MAIRTLGVDIGIASIGWAIVEGEVEGDKIVSKEIIDSGVRIFTKAENPKDSLALPRRMARGARKVIRRKRARMLKIKNFLAKSLGIPLESMLSDDRHPSLFLASKDFLSPWRLRIEALNRLLNKEELARVILHIAKSRGYDDITYGLKESQDEKSGEIAKAIQNNKEELEKGNYRTIGEMMAMRYFEQKRIGINPMQWENVRNKRKDQQDTYKRCIGRSELRKELEVIFQKQKELGNTIITQDFKYRLLGDPMGQDKEILEGMIFFQRPLKGFADKIGDCQHIRGKRENPKRACKHAPSAEEFIAITKIINFLMHCKREFGDVTFDPKEVITKCLEEAKRTKTGLKFAKFREILSLPETFAFRELDYEKKNVEGTKAFISLEGTFRLNEALGDLDIGLKDKVACILGANKDYWGVIQRELQKLNLSSDQIKSIKEAKLNFSHHINLSLEALYHILPLMKEGKRYDEAVEILEEKGIFHKREKQKRDSLPALSELAKEDSYFDVSNPVVNRALSEFRKVLNALLTKYGKFHYFNIELTRDVSKSKKQRGEIEIRQRSNQRENNRAIQKLSEWGMVNTFKNRLKVKLWMQQKECCIYSGRKITREDFEDRLQIDHVLPLSRSLDDSQSNKVLCFISENQNKRNQTPYEWFGSDVARWDAYVGRVYASDFEKSKKRKLLQKHFRDRDTEGFLQRNFVDTGYIGRLIKTYVKDNLDFLPLPSSLPNKGIEHVRIVSGSLTSALRSWWGIGDKDRGHHLHHAQDAIMIAFIQPSIIKAYADFLRSKELHYKKSNEKMQALSQAENKTKLAMRWPIEDFKDRIQQSIQKIIVSHRVSRKVTGALHKETICADSPIITSKTPIECRKKDYYKSYRGEQGVKKAIELGKIRQINGGIVANGEMVRVDVFKSKDKGKFYAVPIYTFDVALGKLPNKAIVQRKKDGAIKDWLEMDENYEFCFSLFKNDAVLIQKKEMKNPVLVIYSGTDSSNASMNFEHPSKFALANEDEKIFFIKKGEVSFSVKSVGIQGLKLFQKVQLSPLGEVKPCKMSKREEIKLKSSPKNV